MSNVPAVYYLMMSQKLHINKKKMIKNLQNCRKEILRYRLTYKMLDNLISKIKN
jgi:hypothetical protein